MLLCPELVVMRFRVKCHVNFSPQGTTRGWGRQYIFSCVSHCSIEKIVLGAISQFMIGTICWFMIEFSACDAWIAIPHCSFTFAWSFLGQSFISVKPKYCLFAPTLKCAMVLVVFKHWNGYALSCFVGTLSVFGQMQSVFRNVFCNVILQCSVCYAFAFFNSTFFSLWVLDDSIFNEYVIFSRRRVHSYAQKYTRVMFNSRCQQYLLVLRPSSGVLLKDKEMNLYY